VQPTPSAIPPAAPRGSGIQATPRSAPPPIELEEVEPIELEVAAPKNWTERLARIARGTVSETVAIVGTTFGQTMRVAGYGLALVRRSGVKSAADRAHLALGERMAAAGIGDRSLLQEIADLDEEIEQARAAKKPFASLLGKRTKWVLQLATPALSRPTVLPNVAAEHQRVLDTRQALAQHDQKLKAARAAVAPKGFAGWRRLALGFGFLFLFLCCTCGVFIPGLGPIGLPGFGGPNYTEEELQTKSFELKVKPWAAAGKTTTNMVTTKISLTAPNFVDGQREGDRKVDLNDEETYQETVLEAGDKLPTKLKRQYTRATAGGANRPYQGRSVLFTWDDGRYEVVAEGGDPLSADDADRLARSVTNFEVDPLLTVLPPGPVKAGDKWPVSANVFFGMRTGEPLFDTYQKAEAEATLTKFYIKNRKLWAVIDVTRKATTRGSAEAEFKPEAEVKGTLTFDVVVDGTSAAGTYTFAAQGSGTTPLRGSEKAETKGDFSFSRQRSVE
jgi:hypothetical protein